MFDLTPFRSNRSPRRREGQLDNFFDSFFDMVDRVGMGFNTDVRETEDEYVIESELAGMDKNDINVELSDNYLTISASREESIEDKEGEYLRRERKAGRYSRSFYIENVEEDGIEANYDNGILKVRLPKKEKEKPKKRTIDIS